MAAITGRRVLVAGGGPIAEATRLSLAERGAKVSVIDDGGGGIGALTSAVGRVVADLGGIDAVVALTEPASHGPVSATDPAEFRRVVDGNLLSVYRLMHVTIPFLTDSHGYFLAGVSWSAWTPAPGRAADGASAAALESLAGAMRFETRYRGIGVGVAYLGPDAGSDQCGHALAAAVEGRTARIFVPWSGRPLRWLRPVLAGRAGAKVAGTSG